MTLAGILRGVAPSLPSLITDAVVWNDYISSAPRGHILQSHEWGECKRQFGWTAERIALVDGPYFRAAAQLLWRHTPLGPIAYLPRGPVGVEGDPAITRQLFSAIHARLRRRGAIFLRVEPNQSADPGLADLGFVRAPATIQADVTIQVDLRPDCDALLAAAKPKTRYNIRLAQRHGVLVTQGTYGDLPAFYRLLEETSRRDHFYIRPLEYYQRVYLTLGDKARLLLAFHEDQLLAGAFVTVFGAEAIYLYGASSGERRNLMPTYLIQWEAMKLAKALGCRRYDFWGIPALVDPATGQPAGDGASVAELGVTGNGLWGVYRFKQGFGGDIVAYTGAWDYIYAPVRYRLWSRLLPAIHGYWTHRSHG